MCISLLLLLASVGLCGGKVVRMGLVGALTPLVTSGDTPTALVFFILGSVFGSVEKQNAVCKSVSSFLNSNMLCTN